MTTTTPHERDIAIRARVIIGRYIRELRIELGICQTELAGLTEMAVGTISKLEAGVLALPSPRAALFARTLAVDPQEFALMVFGYGDPHLFGMVFPGASLEPPTVAVEDMDRVTRTMDRVALRQRYKSARKA